MDGFDQFERPPLLWGRRGEDLEGGSLLPGVGGAAGVAHHGGEVGQQGGQVVHRRPVSQTGLVKLTV